MFKNLNLQPHQGVVYLEHIIKINDPLLSSMSEWLLSAEQSVKWDDRGLKITMLGT